MNFLILLGMYAAFFLAVAFRVWAYRTNIPPTLADLLFYGLMLAPTPLLGPKVLADFKQLRETRVSLPRRLGSYLVLVVAGLVGAFGLIVLHIQLGNKQPAPTPLAIACSAITISGVAGWVASRIRSPRRATANKHR